MKDNLSSDQTWIEMARGHFCGQRLGRTPFGSLLVAAWMAGLVATSFACAEEGFPQRANILLDWAVQDTNTHPKHGFWLAQARFAVGLEDEARQQVAECLDRLHPNDPPFQLWACMDTYLRWQNRYGEALREKTRQAMLATPFFDRQKTSMTENKNVMLAAAAYLSHLAWPESDFASRFLPDDPHGRETLLATMDEYVRFGEREHNSPTYYVHHYGPLRSLGDLASDEPMRIRANLTAEWMLASAAPQWLAGHWAAPTRRAYVPFRAQAQYRASTALLWLFFGGPLPARPASEYSFTIQSVVSDYRPPQILVDIATRRDSPYIHRETHHSPGPLAKFYSTPEMTYYSTTYMTPDYAVYSMIEDVLQWPRWNDQVQRWGVCWRRERGESVLFLLHPTNTKVRNLGASRYEQVLQHQDTLLSVLDVPADDPHPELRGYIPPDPDDVIDESDRGRLYLDYGTIRIGLMVTQGFPWKPGASEFVTALRRAGVVVETAAGEAHESLAAFRDELATRLDAVSWTADPKPALKFTSRDGRELEMIYGTSRQVDGIELVHSLEHWPLLENPWMQQMVGGNILDIRFGPERRTYDFSQWQVTTQNDHLK
jgi:hypothetical protein